MPGSEPGICFLGSANRIPAASLNRRMVTKRQIRATRIAPFLERNPQTKHCKAGGWSGLVVQMDILAPVFAYLTCVAGIIGALVVSFFVVFSAPKQPVMADRSEMIASVNATKSAPLADLKKPVLRDAAADNPAVNHVSPATQKREEAPQRAAAQAAPAQTSGPAIASQKLAAGNLRPKSKITRAQWREMVQQERSRRLAYRQNADFESRFLGYAD
ncbi:MAG TPA: hypothetical protein VMA30_12140 [Xanthobacteraceae bacterium]|nr:hypothetical protein [Xanthobacteraceae bacterium]